MQSPPVAVVTGASRGAGRGIAHALGAAGWRVYLTGRSDGIDAAAREVTAAGGEGIAVLTDHADDAAVADQYIKAGATVHDLTDAALAKWVALAKPSAWKDYAEKNEGCAKLLKLAEKVTA